ncbi:exodeoxyribonuclease VII small subunit [Bdellovibrio sp. HCB337]|uniref:exodeoxyribonuclease VII small subunit n=1 Tax=Bdellovibrio sp. HCB337 TaxID=3394358 RepID=UPI0039A4C276
MDFEKKLGRLEEIVNKMEKGDLALEESLSLFEEGVKLSRECHQKLNDAESKVKLLVSMDQNGKATTTNFASDET